VDHALWKKKTWEKEATTKGQDLSQTGGKKEILPMISDNDQKKKGLKWGK